MRFALGLDRRPTEMTICFGQGASSGIVRFLSRCSRRSLFEPNITIQASSVSFR